MQAQGKMCFSSTGLQGGEKVALALWLFYDPLQDWGQRLFNPEDGDSAAVGSIAYTYISCTLFQIVYLN